MRKLFVLDIAIMMAEPVTIRSSLTKNEIRRGCSIVLNVDAGVAHASCETFFHYLFVNDIMPVPRCLVEAIQALLQLAYVR